MAIRSIPQDTSTTGPIPRRWSTPPDPEPTRRDPPRGGARPATRMPDPTRSPDGDAQHPDQLGDRLAALEVDDPDADVDTEIIHRNTGVRLRTNIQAGSASERVEITAETNADDIPDLIHQLDSYRTVVGEQLAWARKQAQDANQ